jgi:tetratricopeptide (TPR) repeat protein
MDKAGDKQAGMNQPDKEGSKARPSPSKKKMPDIAKLGNARPTKIPRNIKETVPFVASTKVKVNWKLLFGLACAVVFLCFAVYSVTLWNDLALADTANFQEIQQGLKSPDFWLDHWSNAVARPLSEGWTRATFAWDVTSFNWKPGWSHLVNICLHAFTCLYLYFFTFRLSWRFVNEGRWKVNPYFVAAAAAALFAVHPLASGAVAYISGRSAILVSLNYFLVLNCFLLGYLSESVFMAVACYFLCFVLITIALFCSPQAITLPLAMSATALLLKPPSESRQDWLRQRGFEIALFLVMAVAMPFALMLSGLPNANSRNAIGMPPLPPVSYWATQLKSLISYYARCTVVPFGLSTSPPYTVASNFSDPLALVGGVVLVGTAALLFVRQNALAVFGLLLFLMGLFPNILLVQPDYIADHRFYLSLAGLCIVAGAYFGKYFLFNSKQAITVLSALVVIFGAATVWRCLEWRNDISLWKQAVAVNPDSADARISYAQALSVQSKYDQARVEAEKALQLAPSNSFATLIVARSLVGQKHYSEATKPLETTLANASKSPSGQTEAAELRKDLAYCYLHLGRTDEALRMADEAAKVIPDDPMVRLVKGEALVRMRSYLPAFMILQQGFSDDRSNPEFLVPMAEAALGSGQKQWLSFGVGAAYRAYQLDKSRANTLLFARAMIAAKMPKKALDTLDPLLKSEKPDAEANYIASAAHEAAGDTKEAAALKSMALKLDPDIANKVYIPGKERAPKPLPPIKPGRPPAPRAAQSTHTSETKPDQSAH